MAARVLTTLWALTCLAGPAAAEAISTEADSVLLRDMRGNARSLADFEGEVCVLAFLGTDCPIANLYVPGLIQLEADFREQGVQFIAVYPNEPETADDVAGHAYERGIPFLVTKDYGAELAGALGVERVPTVCVIDKTGQLAYRGRIDDQYGAATRRPKPTKKELVDALEAVLAGESPKVAQTPVDGCLIAHERPNKGVQNPTFAKDVAKIMQNRCEGCHRPNQIGPFTLTSYEDAKDHAEMIREVAQQRRMPPWHADERFGSFRNPRRLSDAEVDTLVAWVDQGMPIGDMAKAPAPKKWSSDWSFGKPDVVLKMDRPYTVPASGVVPYKYMVIPTGFKEDKWVEWAEARPGNAEVVHHIIVYIMSPEQPDPFSDRGGQMNVLTAWAPGDAPFKASDGAALRVPKGATLLFEMHYTPSGLAADDQSLVGIKFADKPPVRTVKANLLANDDIVIPAHAPHHRETDDYTFRQDSRILAFLPHMHWRGKHFEYVAHFPDGRKERLLSVPRWDFNWQTGYWFTEPVKVPKGTVVRAIAHWDNSATNPANPDPSEDIYWGLQTWNEMMVGWMYYVHEEPDPASERAPRPDKPLSSTFVFNMMDADDDGWVAGEEIPENFRPLLDEIGLDPEQGLDPVAYEFVYRIVWHSLRRSNHRSTQMPAERGEGEATSANREEDAKR